MVKEEKQFYSIPDIALILERRKQTIWEYIKYGKLKGVRIGRNWKVSKEELERFVGHSVASDKPVKEFLTTQDCGDIMGLDKWSIRRYISYGINGLFLKARKVNGAWLVHRTDLDNFIKERMGK
jgi:excisionase family DNA binding protein